METLEQPVFAYPVEEVPEPAPAEQAPSEPLGRFRTLLPWAAVLGTVIWSLWELRATLLPVSYLDDASVHEQMVRFATARLRAGHNPLTSWFPYLQQGSPQFMHYQSLPAMLTGLVGVAIGPDAAFRWSLYLLWCLWPIVIYGSARLMRLGRYEAAVAAMVSPLLASVPGVGYEQKGYIWIGYGVWTQLFASWMLPFAWAFAWRALEDKRFLAPASICVALTAAFHFETGYLALIPIAVMPFIVRADLKGRLIRAGILLGTSVAAIAWIVVPLLANSNWAAINQPLEHGPLVNGYGARTVLGWLISGQGFDDVRFPSVTILVGAGLVISIIYWMRRKEVRLLVVLFALGLVLCFGRTTWGSLVDVIPGNHDIFFRRFFMAVQLSGIYLAGVGAVGVTRFGVRALRKPIRGLSDPHPRRALSLVPLGLAAALGIALLLPAWISMHNYDELNVVNINYQRGAEATEASAINPIIDYIRSHGGGRTYAGSPSDYGTTFQVGSVQVFKYIEGQDLDEVGYTLRTAGLMDGAEFYFDDYYAGDYALFGIRYLILPYKTNPPRGALPVMEKGPYRLFVMPANSYMRVVDTIGSMTEDRRDIGTASQTYLDSRQPGDHIDYTVAYQGAPAAAPTSPGVTAPAGLPGTVTDEHADLADGSASATVLMARRAVVVLSSSYDPGWHAFVDGKPAQTEMLEPALVGVVVGPGRHTVVFRYVGYSWYPELIGLALLAIALLAFFSLRGWRRRRGSDQISDPVPAAPSS
jgi:hypothetical protein